MFQHLGRAALGNCASAADAKRHFRASRIGLSGNVPPELHVGRNILEPRVRFLSILLEYIAPRPGLWSGRVHGNGGEINLIATLAYLPKNHKFYRLLNCSFQAFIFARFRCPESLESVEKVDSE